MRDIEKRAYETQKFLQEREAKEVQNYTNWDDSNKQDYWDRVICGNWWHSEDNDFPINLIEFRKKVASLEQNFDKFIPWIMLALEDLWFTWNISDIFILDDQAKKALEIQTNVSNNSVKIENTFSKKTKAIEWIDFSFEELAKKMWDLFYEPLASMLNSIAIELEKQTNNDEEIVKLLKEASNHILKAWDHCKPYITDINELEKNSKHTFDIKGTTLKNEQIARTIAYLENDKLKEFLELLSTKLHKDWEADKWRKRLKLANELFACAEKLKMASEKI